MATDGAGRIRGAGFREWIAWQESRFGRSTLQAAYDRLPGELREGLVRDEPCFGIAARRWYPIRSFNGLLDIVTAGLEPALLESLIEEAARYTINALVEGAQRDVFASLATPQRYARLVNALWRMTYDSGRVQVIAHGSQKHETVVSDWKGHHGISCRFHLWAQTVMYERMGFGRVDARRLSCVSRGGLDCRVMTTW